MSYRNDRLNRSMKSIDLAKELSDNGQGVRRMLEEIEPTPDDSLDPNQELAGAVLRLIIAGKEYLVETLLLIAKNRNNRNKTINDIAKKWEISYIAAERRYFRHRDLLLEFFMSV